MKASAKIHKSNGLTSKCVLLEYMHFTLPFLIGIVLISLGNVKLFCKIK